MSITQRQFREELRLIYACDRRGVDKMIEARFALVEEFAAKLGITVDDAITIERASSSVSGKMRACWAILPQYLSGVAAEKFIASKQTPRGRAIKRSYAILSDPIQAASIKRLSQIDALPEGPEKDAAYERLASVHA
jgi:hypothetical protein